MAEYALMSLNMPEHGLILLNVSEYACKIPEKTVVTMPGFSLCLIILDI